MGLRFLSKKACFHLIEVNYKSCLTLGIIVVWAHSTPNFSTSFLRLLVAASRMAKTWSTNQVMHSVLSFSSKNSTPSWPKNACAIQNNETYLVQLYLSKSRLVMYLPARSGIYSMIASRTLHLVSSASSTMAGRRDCESCWIPITSLTQSKLEMIFNLTSGHSSFNWARNNGRRCSIVLWKIVTF